MGTHISQTLTLSGYIELAKNLFRGNTLSNCPMPCKTFRTNAKMTSKRPTKNIGHVLLSFSEKVTILSFSKKVTIMSSFYVQISMTINELETPSVSELLSSIGGSIGLWLGLGAFQAIEILSRIFVALANKVRMMYCVHQSAGDE